MVKVEFHNGVSAVELALYVGYCGSFAKTKAGSDQGTDGCPSRRSVICNALRSLSENRKCAWIRVGIAKFKVVTNSVDWSMRQILQHRCRGIFYSGQANCCLVCGGNDKRVGTHDVSKLR